MNVDGSMRMELTTRIDAICVYVCVCVCVPSECGLNLLLYES
jgi:hypothetical protein